MPVSDSMWVQVVLRPETEPDRARPPRADAP